jgi:adenine-specific DNA-methyltransferase
VKAGSSLAVLEAPEDRKARGAFFTPPAIADFLASWALAGRPDARVLDPTCGDGVFLRAAARLLRDLGSPDGGLDGQVYGVDVHKPTLRRATEALESDGLDAHLIPMDFFQLDPPGELFSSLPIFDAVIGNPPFIRYQQHIGDARRASLLAALRQGVRLSGLASSWAALLVHAGAFLAPDGRLGMVMPAELLTVGYAEPVRQWLRRRFAAVKLVFFERLQFTEALENVVLLLAQGSGGCDAFSLYHVHDAEDLLRIQPFDEFAVTLSAEGKWTDLLLPMPQRQLFKRVVADHFAALGTYGSPELGTVTGANAFFTLNETTRTEYGLVEGVHVRRISPPGTRHLRGLGFTNGDWERLRDADEPVWILHPNADTVRRGGFDRYLKIGEEQGVPDAYKCTVRKPWWRPPVVTAPDLFFTYMSHRYPRLITNRARATLVNSMHGVRLRGVAAASRVAREALPLLALNSVTMLGAEVFGRSYGGGILKMEPREAATLPVPKPAVLEAGWAVLREERDVLDRQLRNGLWTNVVARVDEVLLREVAKLSGEEATTLHDAARSLRTRRLGHGHARGAANGN